MKKVSLLVLPLLTLLLTGCGSEEEKKEYFKDFTLVCNLNGGKYTSVFMNEKRIKNPTDSYSAYINLNYYDGGLRIMPSIDDMIAPAGKIFAGWYFDESCKPENIVSEYAMDKMVLNYDLYDSKTKNVYARWIDSGTVDLVLELNNTKKKSNGLVNKYAEHEYIGASFTDEFLSEHPGDASSDVYRRNVVLDELQSISKNPIMPELKDVLVEEGKHVYKGCQVYQDDYWNYSGDAEDDFDDGYPNGHMSGIQNTIQSIEGKQQTIFLYPDYVRKQYLNIEIAMIDSSFLEQGQVLTNYLIKQEAQNRYKDLYFNEKRHPDYLMNSPNKYNVHVQYFVDEFDNLTQEIMDSWCLKENDFEFDRSYVYPIINSFSIDKWRFVYAENDGEQTTLKIADFTLENLKSIQLAKYDATRITIHPVISIPE